MADAYVKTVWADGENKYDIKTQADVVVNDDIKIVYSGVGGVAISAARLNNAEDGIEQNNTNIGDLAYTENNYITDDEPLTDSVDKLDIQLKDTTDTANGKMSDVSDDTSPTLGGNLDRSNKTIHGTLYNNGDSGAAKTIDWSAQGNMQKVNVSEASTLTFTAPPGPAALYLQVTYGGNYEITWPATIRWPGNTAPTQTKATGKTDLFTFVWDVVYTRYWGGYMLNYTMA